MTGLTDNETAAVRRLPAGALEVVALIGGLLTGGVAAWAYYDELLRPPAHTFGLWITLVALLAARQQLRPAVVRGCLALIGAVLAFYVGKKVMYGIEYPGMPYSLNGTQVMTWLGLVRWQVRTPDALTSTTVTSPVPLIGGGLTATAERSLAGQRQSSAAVSAAHLSALSLLSHLAERPASHRAEASSGSGRAEYSTSRPTRTPSARPAA